MFRYVPSSVNDSWLDDVMINRFDDVMNQAGGQSSTGAPLTRNLVDHYTDVCTSTYD